MAMGSIHVGRDSVHLRDSDRSQTLWYYAYRSTPDMWWMEAAILADALRIQLAHSAEKDLAPDMGNAHAEKASSEL